LLKLRQALRKTGAVVELAPQVEVSVLLCDDPYIQGLNLQYRDQDKPTDVLSFAQDDARYLGDIVISVETAVGQAQKAGWSVESELALLAVHGMLHLLGFDDEYEEGAKEMEELTREIMELAEIKLPESFHPFFQLLQP
jgi:probable rRNA maturation factor